MIKYINFYIIPILKIAETVKAMLVTVSVYKSFNKLLLLTYINISGKMLAQANKNKNIIYGGKNDNRTKRYMF